MPRTLVLAPTLAKFTAPSTSNVPATFVLPPSLSTTNLLSPIVNPPLRAVESLTLKIPAITVFPVSLMILNLFVLIIRSPFKLSPPDAVKLVLTLPIFNTLLPFMFKSLF